MSTFQCINYVTIRLGLHRAVICRWQCAGIHHLPSQARHLLQPVSCPSTEVEMNNRSALCYCLLSSFLVPFFSFFDPQPFARFAKQLGRTTFFWGKFPGPKQVESQSLCPKFFDGQDLGFCLWAKTSKTSSWLLENIHQARPCPELCESTGLGTGNSRFRHSLHWGKKQLKLETTCDDMKSQVFC